MSKLLKSLCIFLIAIILIASLGSGLYFAYENKNALSTASRLYTEQDMQDAYSTGYDKGLDNYYELLAEIDTLTLNLNNLEYQMDLAANALLESELSNESKEKLISQLNGEIARLDIYINELNDMVLDLKAENQALNKQVVELQAIKLSLEETVIRLTDQINSFEAIENGRWFLTFIYDDALYTTVVVPYKSPDEYEVPVIANTPYVVFMGWSLSPGGEVIDFNNFTIDRDMTFYAIFKKYYDVNFVSENVLISSKIIEFNNSVLEVPVTDNTDVKKFVGWSINGADIINPLEYKITGLTNFVAVWDLTQEIKWSVGGSIYKTQLLQLNDAILPPSDPELAGYKFSHWSVDGVRVSNFNNIFVTGPMVFVAHFLGVNQTIELDYRSTNTSKIDVLAAAGIDKQALASYSVTFTVEVKKDNGSYVSYTVTLNNANKSYSKRYDSVKAGQVLWWYTDNLDYWLHTGIDDTDGIKLSANAYSNLRSNENDYDVPLEGWGYCRAITIKSFTYRLVDI